MKPDWDKLKTDMNNEKILLADVDCIGSGKDLCADYEIKQYPTMKYGDPNILMDYTGKRDHKSLWRWAQRIDKHCSPASLGLCDSKIRAQLEELMDMSAADLDAKVKEVTEVKQKAEADFKEVAEGLQKSFKEVKDKKEQAVKEIKDSGLGLMKSVLAAQTKKSQSKTEL